MPMRFQASDILILLGQARCLSHQYLSEIVAYWLRIRMRGHDAGR